MIKIIHQKQNTEDNKLFTARAFFIFIHRKSLWYEKQHEVKEKINHIFT